MPDSDRKRCYCGKYMRQRIRYYRIVMKITLTQMPDATLVQTVPGVGLTTATALIAMVGDIRRFRSRRCFASFLGLTPKEASSAARRRLGAISKQGDAQLPSRPRGVAGRGPCSKK